MAVKRLMSPEKHLLRKPDVAVAYLKSISQYMEKGYIRKCHQMRTAKRKVVFPHFVIVKPQKVTIKVRIVLIDLRHLLKSVSMMLSTKDQNYNVNCFMFCSDSEEIQWRLPVISPRCICEYRLLQKTNHFTDFFGDISISVKNQKNTNSVV